MPIDDILNRLQGINANAAATPVQRREWAKQLSRFSDAEANAGIDAALASGRGVWLESVVPACAAARASQSRQAESQAGQRRSEAIAAENRAHEARVKAGNDLLAAMADRDEVFARFMAMQPADSVDFVKDHGGNYFREWCYLRAHSGLPPERFEALWVEFIAFLKTSRTSPPTFAEWMGRREDETPW